MIPGEIYCPGMPPSVVPGDAAALPFPRCILLLHTPLVWPRSCPLWLFLLPAVARATVAFARWVLPAPSQTAGSGIGTLPAQHLLHWLEGWSGTTCIRSSGMLVKNTDLWVLSQACRLWIPGEGGQEVSSEHAGRVCSLARWHVGTEESVRPAERVQFCQMSNLITALAFSHRGLHIRPHIWKAYSESSAVRYGKGKALWR